MIQQENTNTELKTSQPALGPEFTSSALLAGEEDIPLVSSVIPVYLGQADDVRARVRSYGRHGSHLQNSLLFSNVFSRGHPIVYRWAATKSKEEAERREGELLGKYDYGWNKRNNGDRRAEEIRRKLGFCCKETWWSSLSKLVECFLQFGDAMEKGLQSAICRVGLGRGVKAPAKGRN